jgi:hypothetical protein
MTSDGQDRELLARIAKKDATAVPKSAGSPGSAWFCATLARPFADAIIEPPGMNRSGRHNALTEGRNN